MNTDNIKLFEGGNKPNVTADTVRQLKADLPMMIQSMALMA